MRLFSFTILMGVFLSANFNSEYLPAPIPIDFGVNNGMRSDSTICESCNISYEADTMGAACCDEATQFNSDFTCEVLETTYLWNCSGCACAEDDDNWTTIFGCMDELACNYNSIAIWDDGSCSFTDDICQSCAEGEVVDNDDDGDSICNEDDNCPDTANADQTDTDSDGVGDACDSWTELNALGSDNQISLSWDTVGSARPSFMNRDGCEDDPDICIWEAWYFDYDNPQECEDNGGIWGSYLEYFGTSCAEMVYDAGCDASILYWTVSDLCPESCEVCLDGCTDMSACNYNPDATDDDGSCVDPEENYDCDGNCIVEIDCNDECGGSAMEDECDVCGGDGSSCGGSAVSLEIQNVDIENGTLDIYISNNEPIVGFQFFIGGIIIDNFGGGVAEEYLDFLDVNNSADCDGGEFDPYLGCNLIVSFSLDNSTIPVGTNQLLMSVSFTNVIDEEICFLATESIGEVSSEYGWSWAGPCFASTNSNECLDMDFGDCYEIDGNWIYGCMDQSACNYNENATADDSSCEFPEFECIDGSIVCISSDCSGGEPVTYNVYRDGEILTGGLMEPNYVDSGLGYSEFHCYTVTYNYGGDFESELSNEACAETNPEPVILGCTNEDACNYNAEATVDDGSCVLAEENYDCEGNCIVDTDCAGECGGDDSSCIDCAGVPNGDSELDNCGTCDNDPSNDCDMDCSGDWGGSLENDECGVCGGNGPEIECLDGELVCNESDCSTGIDYTLTIDNHHNLVSFYALPEDVSIAGIMSELGDNAISVMAEGNSAINLDGVWIGSLTEITPENGYWISISNFPDNLSVIGFDMDPDRMYKLHEGPNLISYPDSGSADLSSAIPDDVEHLFTAIISEGISALNSDNGWAGSLTGFQGGAGYWVIVQEDLSFSYNTEDLLARSAHSFSEKLPDEDGFIVAQSSRQAFYYVDDIKLDNGGVKDGDWILSYNNDVLAGIRQWKGNTVDIPNMGSAGDMVTAGYFNEGDVPTFKLLKQSTGKIITLEGNIPSWSDNGIYSIGELYEKQPIPELFVLNRAYPNPFNPTTTIGFGLPDQSEIIIEIYNLYGKRVETLVDKSMPAGYSSIVWNADKLSSGLYFVKLSAHSLKGIKYTSIQKLMLVK